MQTYQYKVTDPIGLHARPSGRLVQCAKNCNSNVTVSVGKKTVGAKRLFAVMGLGIKQNDTIAFNIEGNDEQTDCVKLRKFCQENI